jgi:site-specific DNA recombinase
MSSQGEFQAVGEGHNESKPVRRQQRQRAERGLPDDGAILALAVTYLEIQRRLWPELVPTGILTPKSDKKAPKRLVAEFKHRFLDDTVEPQPFNFTSILWKVLAFVYLRYSDDNSNPRSLAQQLRNVLERAHRDGAFIPWQWVFADAAVTGTTAARRGYSMAKALIKADGEPRHLYVDEIGRAARHAVEALTLGESVGQAHKRMIGVSDGFDTDMPHAKLMLHIYAMLQEWFVDQLRGKVDRGMTDAFLAGRNVNMPALGHKLVPIIGDDGQPLCGPDGKP